ncbi:PH domain-containing protein [Flavobacterium sp. DG1-102-2]|uniref:PH domain-containing protein n=1 Tax=Flavobacterium sp. DG1-102-2 TaxID=3081663 RepID=UPI00294908C5|nr:PH domain-containing protein [Flavobacterium sp. DG1-102-2]MDV6167084.1 PH domain-containing protein [Flavobacterium sp. DG1-102-2]
MKSNFSEPQRQSLIGVVIMFADTFQSALRALWPFLIVWVYKIDQFGRAALWAVIVTILLGICIIAYLRYRNFTFFLDEGNEEFVIRKGIWNKSRIAIPLDKIQQVNINQSLIQKIIGVHALEVDTAGSSGKEVSIRAINHETALSLKDRLLEAGYSKDNTNNAKEDSDAKSVHPFIQISLLSLFKTGITSNYTRSFALLLAFIITSFQYIEDFIEAAGYDEDPLDEYINPEILLRFITFIILGIMVLTLIINLVRTIVRYYNFRITKQHDSLLLSYGLLNTKNTILRPNKVQIVTVGNNFFQKKFNMNDLKIRQASGVEANDRDQKKTAIEIPGCSHEEKDMLLKFLLGKIPEKGTALKPSLRKIIMETIIFLVIPLGVYLLLAFLVYPSIKEYIVFLPLYALFVGVLIYFGFRHYRLFVSDDFIIKQSGAWDIDREFIVPDKIQTISIKQYFWHKGSDIGIVTLHTAGGTLSFGLSNYTRLKQLVNYWLYQVETGTGQWM